MLQKYKFVFSICLHTLLASWHPLKMYHMILLCDDILEILEKTDLNISFRDSDSTSECMIPQVQM